MAQIKAYIGFSSGCREAMEFYQGCFGGELLVQTVAESPTAAEMPAELQEKVMHASLESGDLSLMASDLGAEAAGSGMVSLMLECASAEEIERLFERLSDGGQVTQPLVPSFWGSTFGHLTDRHGIKWMLNHTH